MLNDAAAHAYRITKESNFEAGHTADKIVDRLTTVSDSLEPSRLKEQVNVAIDLWRDFRSALPLRPSGAGSTYVAQLGHDLQQHIEELIRLESDEERHIAGSVGRRRIVLQLTGSVVVGTAVQQAVRESQALPTGFSSAFPRAFVNTANLWGWSTEQIAPETLPSLIDDIRSPVLQHLVGSPWGPAVAHDVLNLAGRIFGAPERIDPNETRKVRLATLCLAAEVESEVLAEDLRRVAAGVTLLEMRANGTAPKNETIILAADRPRRLSAIPPK